MSGGLMHSGDDAPERCSFCSRDAVGPCASCHRLVCGACCTLTEGGVRTWAVCLDCDRKGARTLRGKWTGFMTFIGAILLALFVVVMLLAWLSGAPR